MFNRYGHIVLEVLFLIMAYGIISRIYPHAFEVLVGIGYSAQHWYMFCALFWLFWFYTVFFSCNIFLDVKREIFGSTYYINL